MAHSIGFKEANKILDRPPSLTAEECLSLEVYQDKMFTISRWQLSDEEIEELKRNGGKVYIAMLGHAIPPHKIEVLSPFREPEKPSESEPSI